MRKYLLMSCALLVAADAFAQATVPAVGSAADVPGAPINYGVLCPDIGRSALALANARDGGKDIAAAGDYVRSNFQSLGLDTSDQRVNNVVLAMIPGNAAMVYARKDLNSITLRYAAAGVCAIHMAGDRNANDTVAIVDSAARCQNTLPAPLKENELVSCVAAAVSNVTSGPTLQKGLQAARQGDYATALEQFKPLAAQGNAEAQYSLGVMYHHGFGVPQDYGQALSWYRKSAEQGYALAQYNLGLLYQDGYGVAKDYSEAARWYGMASDQGFAYAQSSLEFLYAKGLGVRQDFVVAYALDILAAPTLSSNPRVAPLADKTRSELLAKMTSQQIEAGKALAPEMKSLGVTKATQNYLTVPQK